MHYCSQPALESDLVSTIR